MLTRVTKPHVPPAKLVSSLSSQGLDADALAWLAKSLHPPGPTRAAAMPTCNSANTAFPEQRVTIKLPPGIGPSPLFDVLIVKEPGDTVAVRWAIGPAGTDFNAIRNGSGPGGSTFPTDYITDTAYIQPFDAKSVGTLIGFEQASVSERQIPVAFVAPEAGNMHWRKTASSITVHLDAPVAFDQGMVYATQSPASYARACVNTSAGVATDAGDDFNVMYRQRVVNLPLDEEAMAAVDPKLYAVNAREGVYQPIRYLGDGKWVEPDRLMGESFVPSFPGGPTCIVQANATSAYGNALGFLPPVSQSSIFAVSPPGGSTGTWELTRPFLCPTIDTTYPNTLPFLPSDSGYDQWMTSVIIFRGISNQATISVTTHDVIEQMPLASSLFRAYVMPPPLASPKALVLYARMVEASAHSFPASYNSFGSVWNDIKKVASSVWKVVEPVLPGFITAATEGEVSYGDAKALTSGVTAAGKLVGSIGHKSRTAPSGATVIARVRNPGLGGKSVVVPGHAVPVKKKKK